MRIMTRVRKEARYPEHTARGKTGSDEDMDFDAFAQRVEKKAYELYQKRGCQDGHAWDDWFEAQRIVEEEMIAGGQ